MRFFRFLAPTVTTIATVLLCLTVAWAAPPTPAVSQQMEQSATSAAPAATAPIRGNRNSKIYHLLVGCPSYGRISPKNIVEFPTEEAAKAAGYRKAGNCR